MHQEKDYLQRDIERMTLFLKILLRRVAGLSDKDVQPQYDQVEKELKEQMDFPIRELEEWNATELEDKMKWFRLFELKRKLKVL